MAKARGRRGPTRASERRLEPCASVGDGGGRPPADGVRGRGEGGAAWVDWALWAAAARPRRRDEDVAGAARAAASRMGHGSGTGAGSRARARQLAARAVRRRSPRSRARARAASRSIAPPLAAPARRAALRARRRRPTAAGRSRLDERAAELHTSQRRHASAPSSPCLIAAPGAAHSGVPGGAAPRAGSSDEARASRARALPKSPSLSTAHRPRHRRRAAAAGRIADAAVGNWRRARSGGGAGEKAVISLEVAVRDAVRMQELEAEQQLARGARSAGSGTPPRARAARRGAARAEFHQDRELLRARPRRAPRLSSPSPSRSSLPRRDDVRGGGSRLAISASRGSARAIALGGVAARRTPLLRREQLTAIEVDRRVHLGLATRADAPRAAPAAAHSMTRAGSDIEQVAELLRARDGSACPSRTAGALHGPAREIRARRAGRRCFRRARRRTRRASVHARLCARAGQDDRAPEPRHRRDFKAGARAQQEHRVFIASLARAAAAQQRRGRPATSGWTVPPDGGGSGAVPTAAPARVRVDASDVVAAIRADEERYGFLLPLIESGGLRLGTAGGHGGRGWPEARTHCRGGRSER